MESHDKWTHRVARWLWRLALMPHRVTEALSRIKNIEIIVKKYDQNLVCNTTGGLSANFRLDESTSRQQIYKGYSDQDLKIFEKFSGTKQESTEGFITDFLGVRTRVTFLHGLEGGGSVTGIPVPDDGLHAEAIEWIGLLKSVVSARDRYTAMELGAGWGPWVVAGAAASRKAGLEVAHLCAIEADPGHFEFLIQHFEDNGLDITSHRLINAAVGVSAGKAKWPKVENPAADWGSQPLLEDFKNNAEVRADHIGRHFDEWIDVEVLSFEEQLLTQPIWDLVHIDVQGWEVDLCSAAIEALDKRVRWLVVGTHNAKLHGDLIELLFRRGWFLENEKPPRFTWRADATSLTGMTNHDGAQVWRNPHLIPS